MVLETLSATVAQTIYVMRKPKLNIKTLVKEAAKFAEVERIYDEPSLYGVTDGKAVGTYLEHKFSQFLAGKYSYEKGNSASGIDLPGLGVDMKVTSIRQPQSSSPYKSAREKNKWEFGDFQTPYSLAQEAMSVLEEMGIEPQTILEPTCGKGSFLIAAAEKFSTSQRYVGVDINAEYLAELQKSISRLGLAERTDVIAGDFFAVNWAEILSSLPEPILIVGNPPWVTSAELGMLKSRNVPNKSNFQKRRGYDAKTGKSNFDISEWMLMQHLAWLSSRRGTIAVLCKTAVARKVLTYAWKHGIPINLARIFLIDAVRHFGASVDACFLVIDMSGGVPALECLVYDDFAHSGVSLTLGYRDELLLADVGLYQRWQHLKGNDQAYIWRSGIKHDCSKVMEMERSGTNYRNKAGELVALEDDYLYPMLKSSDVGNGEIRYGRRYMLVTQQCVGEATEPIQKIAPKTWRYLQDHKETFTERGSSIYRDRPHFSIFGVGPYSFAPWKVAISGFYRDLTFKIVSQHEGKSVVLDDTVNFLPCWSEAEAQFIGSILNSQPAQDFFRSMIFWADKRPITVEVLKRLNLRALSVELDCEADYLRFAQLRRDRNRKRTNQLPLWV